MENLLPPVANIDVTSNDYREITLPYQQWEAKRTQYLPSTPSDIDHLLPPINASRKSRARHAGTPTPEPPPQRAEPSPPRPAPVDRNLSGLYDPALDPSPIGVEGRGATQPIRSTRVVPRCHNTSYGQTRGKYQSTPHVPTLSGETTIVTILNGYRREDIETLQSDTNNSNEDRVHKQHRPSWAGNEDAPARETHNGDFGYDTAVQNIRLPGVAIDVFVQGFSTGVEHATILPSEVLRRSLQQPGSTLRSSLASHPEAPSGAVGSDTISISTMGETNRDASLGLTIILSGGSDWFNFDGIDERGSAASSSHRISAHVSEHSPITAAPDEQLLSLKAKATQALFQKRNKDGRWAPPTNAFRVQFEPGPLGMEFEEDLLQRSVVQIRRVLQAGQAEQDRRISAGCLLVAVGDWEHDQILLPSPSQAMGSSNNPPGEYSTESKEESTFTPGGTGPIPIQSLADLEKAVLSRSPDRLFVVWVLDRSCPEAVAALGEPALEADRTAGNDSDSARSIPRKWSSRSLSTCLHGDEGASALLPTGDKSNNHDGGGSDGMKGLNDASLFGDRYTELSPPLKIAIGNSGAKHGWNGVGTVVADEEAPGWEASKRGRRQGTNVHQQHPQTSQSGTGADQEDKQLGVAGLSRPSPRKQTDSRSDSDTPVLSFTTRDSMASSAPEMGHIPRTGKHSPGYPRRCVSPNAQQFCSGSHSVGHEVEMGQEGSRWVFETGEGMFDENDQGLAARRRHLYMNDGSGTDVEKESPICEEEERPVLPMGLQASTNDDVAVFIWFCNSHQSAVMQVSWIDYDGRLVPRRALGPGACYFERSFASHPWVLQHHAATDENNAVGDRDCCIIRLGNAMAAVRLTGSLLWNPSTTTLSLMRQAKVGVAGPGAGGLSESGTATDGAGVAPGKKRLCLAGAEREAEAARSAAERARVRAEKFGILDEMRAWRTHPPGGVASVGSGETGKLEAGATGGLGEGAPNLRVVMRSVAFVTPNVGGVVEVTAEHQKHNKLGLGEDRPEQSWALHAKFVPLPDLSQREFPELRDDPYDLVVLGSGPGGEAAAVQASRLGATVAVVEIKKSFGGPTGLTSKAVREAAKQINSAVKNIGGDRRRQIRRLWKLRFPALRAEAEVLQAAETRERLAKSDVDLYIGQAEIVPKEKRPPGEEGEVAVRVCRPTNCIDIPAHHVCIATGSRPNRPPSLRSGSQLPFKSGVVIDATEMGAITDLPNACAIIGGGVIAVEYANVLAGLGVGVSLLCGEKEFMPFLAEELRVELKRRMARDHVLFVHTPIKRLDVVVTKNIVLIQLEEAPKDGPKQPKRLRVDLVLYSGGRDANSEGLGCDDAGVDLARYGRIKVDDAFRTSNPRVFAVGDVIGPPGLASSAQMGGRAVATSLFNDKMEKLRQYMLETSTDLEDVVDDPFFAADADSPAGRHGTSKEDELEMLGRDISLPQKEAESLFDRVAGAPLTLWTIPEISSVGLTEDDALAQGMKEASEGGSLVTGYAYFKDIARGRLSGDPEGWLKIVSRADEPNKHVIVGVQIIGEGANELIQMGSILIHSGSTLEELSNTPFAAVTLSALYQVASDDGLCNSPYNLQRHPARNKAYEETF